MRRPVEAARVQAMIQHAEILVWQRAGMHVPICMNALCCTWEDGPPENLAALIATLMAHACERKGRARRRGTMSMVVLVAHASVFCCGFRFVPSRHFRA